jgi:L-ascorbate metabolism protein UlaG (beta-lactamase superfamily)
VLLTHARFDHFHKPTLRRLPSRRIAVVPWGVAELTRGLGFDRVIELEWWDTLSARTHHAGAGQALGACTIGDHHWATAASDRTSRSPALPRRGQRLLPGFKEIGSRCAPEIALLPIGAYHPEGLRNVHMGPEDALNVFRDVGARWLVPMHYGTFRLSFEDMDEPPARLREVARQAGLGDRLRILEEGVPRCSEPRRAAARLREVKALTVPGGSNLLAGRRDGLHRTPHPPCRHRLPSEGRGLG